jgi:HTH-type transcriptional regulator/antitoxin HigA
MKAVLEKYQLDRPALTVITSEAQHRSYTAALIELEEQDHVSAEDKKYAGLLAALIEKYEKEKYPIDPASPVEILKELITANDLRQKDLAPLLGGESGVSAILSGERRINMDHAVRLGERFRVSPLLFFPVKSPTKHSTSTR